MGKNGKSSALEWMCYFGAFVRQFILFLILQPLKAPDSNQTRQSDMLLEDPDAHVLYYHHHQCNLRLLGSLYTLARTLLIYYGHYHF